MTIDTTLVNMFGSSARPRITTPSTTRRLVDWSASTDDAIRLLDPLPAPGETLHFLLGGNSFALAAVVPAIVTLTRQPCSVWFSTLGIRREGVDLFNRMHQDGQLTSIAGLFSYYFEASDHEAARYAVDTFRTAGHRVAITRTHCKLLLMGTKDGTRHFVLESSANLRSCKCTEQATLTDDEPLFEFYETWIEKQLP